MVFSTEQDRQTERRNFLLRLMVSLRAPSSDHEDLAQQALLRFFGSGYAERDLAEKQENALLARIGYSTFIDACRKKKASNLGDREAEIPDHFSGSDREATIQRVREMVRGAKLSPVELDLVECKFGKGQSLAAIARVSGLHVNTIRRRLERIMGRIRRQAGAHEFNQLNGRAEP